MGIKGIIFDLDGVVTQTATIHFKAWKTILDEFLFFIGEKIGNVPELFEKQYIIHADGTHPHVHGANLGIRADVLDAIGGWRSLSAAEDHDLWNRLKVSNSAIVSLSELFVVTSGRKKGRAPHGFAGKVASYNIKKT